MVILQKENLRFGRRLREIREKKRSFLEGKLKEKKERGGLKLGNPCFLKEKKVILHSKGFNFQLIISEGLVRSSQSVYNK